ncbi:MAG: helix-turn-helix domain-containing protein [Flavobacteriales bacterium]|jgi:hypothetical protein|nr:helix-turn-helix domain-containing protein [Flavobacteriales bacterium]
MSELKYKYHPVIPDLKISEDGTSIIWKDAPVLIRNYTKNGKVYPRVNIIGRTFMVSRLVCYTFNGPPPENESIVKHIHGDSNHYKNLMWELSGSNNPLIQRKMSEKDKIEAARLLKKGKTKKAVAEQFKVSISTIKRLKRVYT